uniref:PDE4_UCR domain-containing protein n=1 Tax=Ascaris lumbricoides TaxID=6252 RepID=A0A0M3IMI2_ASCLU
MHPPVLNSMGAVLNEQCSSSSRDVTTARSPTHSLSHMQVTPTNSNHKICDVNSDRPSTLNLKREQATMFMVSPANAVPIYSSYTAIAPSSSSCDIDRMLDDMSIGEDLAASSESDKSFGGLSRSIRMKRSVSSLKGSNGQGCDIDLKTQCVVEARQSFISLSPQPGCSNKCALDLLKKVVMVTFYTCPLYVLLMSNISIHIQCLLFQI